jgi:beta-phosphoglucomutase
MNNHNTPIKAVLFDMDGVLTDSEPLICEAAVRMFREFGLKVKPSDFIPFVGTGEDRYLGGVAATYDFALDIPSAKHRTYEIYLELVPDRLTAFPGAQDLVHACQASGLKIAVVSSADAIKIKANLDQIGLPLETWDAVITAENVARKKPAPDLYLAAAARLRLPAAACVVIEDAVNGIEAARAAGMRCVAVAQTFNFKELNRADLVRAAIGDLTVQDLTGGVTP